MAGFGQEIQTYPVYFSFKLKNRSSGEAAKQPGPERLSQGSGSSCCHLGCQGLHAGRPPEWGRWTREVGVHGSRELPLPTPEEAPSPVLDSLEERWPICRGLSLMDSSEWLQAFSKPPTSLSVTYLYAFPNKLNSWLKKKKKVTNGKQNNGKLLNILLGLSRHYLGWRE